MPRKEAEVCKCGCHHGHKWKLVVLGLLVLANEYWSVMSWPYFIGGLAVLGGLLKMLLPCKCCK